MYGKYLSAAVLPPAAQLLQGSSVLRAHQQAWQTRLPPQQEELHPQQRGPHQPQQQGEQQRRQQEEGGDTQEQLGRPLASSTSLPGVTRHDLQCRIVQVAALAQYAAVSED